MDGRDLVAKRLGISLRQAGDLLAVECRGPWRWTKADIADAVREWTERRGQLPRDRDWRAGPGACLPRRHEAAKWPSYTTVTNRFDTWEEAAFFALCGREWKAEVIGPDDPTADLRTTDIHDALGRLVIDFLFEVKTGATRPEHHADPRWGGPV
ncbi:MAG: hypothetical protein QOD83_277 [Solirubrobacteraceae bacterium]|nr:hypothetical protein [Solirubrobacteraceae bacterium]